MIAADGAVYDRDNRGRADGRRGRNFLRSFLNNPVRVDAIISKTVIENVLTKVVSLALTTFGITGRAPDRPRSPPASRPSAIASRGWWAYSKPPRLVFFKSADSGSAFLDRFRRS